MAQTTHNFKTIADATKFFGGEANLLKELNALAANKAARTEYNAKKNALLKYAMEQVKAGKLVVPGVNA